jgi:hypothetical protein
MHRSKLAAVGTSLLLTLSLAACGGGDDEGGGDAGGSEDEASTETVSAGDWASGVCTAVGDWVTTIQEQSTAITTDFTSGSPEEGKEVFGSFISDAVAETETMIEEVEAAGVPDVEGGEEYAEELTAAFEEARDVLAGVQAQIDELPTDPQGFQEAAAGIGPSIQEALGAVGGSISEPESQELKDAFEEEEACASAPGA